MPFPALRSPRFSNTVNVGDTPRRGQANLGALQATLAGTAQYSGTAAAVLGGLTATVVGTAGAVRPLLAANLGALTATAAGSFAPYVPPPPPTFTFTGPVQYVRGTTDVDPIAWARNPAGNLLMRHYGAQAVGQNVFILNDNTVTTNMPIDPTTVAHTLFGGHVTPVTQVEANLLIAAGYGAYLTEDT